MIEISFNLTHTYKSIKFGLFLVFDYEFLFVVMFVCRNVSHVHRET